MLQISDCSLFSNLFYLMALSIKIIKPRRQSFEYQWNDNWQEKTEIFKGNSDLEPLYPLQIPHGMPGHRSRSPKLAVDVFSVYLCSP